MQYFLIDELKDKYRTKFESATVSLESINESVLKSASYDIFLSHSYSDKNLIISIRNMLVEKGYTVYVDWIEDSQLNRSKVTKKTAATLRERMSKAKSLIYVTTENSSSSKWMPWELGYFDGKKGKVAIMPVMKNHDNRFHGQEYLDLYPLVTKGLRDLVINKNTLREGFVSFLENETTFNSWLSS